MLNLWHDLPCGQNPPEIVTAVVEIPSGASDAQSQLTTLAEDNERRRSLAAGYTAKLAGVGDLATPAETPDRRGVFHLYVLRTALTGTHVLLTGEVETDLTALMDRYGFSEAMRMVSRPCCRQQTTASSMVEAGRSSETTADSM